MEGAQPLRGRNCIIQESPWSLLEKVMIFKWIPRVTSDRMAFFPKREGVPPRALHPALAPPTGLVYKKTFTVYATFLL